MHEMPENDVHLLRACCGLPEDAELPAKLVEKYWELKRCCDRISAPPSPRELAFLAALCGFGKPTASEQRPPSLVELWKRKEVSFGTRVEAVWRDKTVPGQLHGVTADNQLRVLLDGDTEVRTLAPDKVSLPVAKAA